MKNTIEILGELFPIYLIRSIGKITKGKKYRTISLKNDFSEYLKTDDSEYCSYLNSINTFEKVRKYFEQDFNIEDFTETLKFKLKFTDHTEIDFEILCTDLDTKLEFIEYHSELKKEFDSKLNN